MLERLHQIMKLINYYIIILWCGEVWPWNERFQIVKIKIATPVDADKVDKWQRSESNTVARKYWFWDDHQIQILMVHL